jgi:hypothetical protein
LARGNGGQKSSTGNGDLKASDGVATVHEVGNSGDLLVPM